MRQNAVSPLFHSLNLREWLIWWTQWLTELQVKMTVLRWRTEHQEPHEVQWTELWSFASSTENHRVWVQSERGLAEELSSGKKKWRLWWASNVSQGRMQVKKHNEGQHLPVISWDVYFDSRKPSAGEEYSRFSREIMSSPSLEFSKA